MTLNLRELFGKDHVLRDVAFWSGAVLEEEENRVHKFVTVIGPIEGATFFLTMSLRIDSTPESNGSDILQWKTALVQHGIARNLSAFRTD